MIKKDKEENKNPKKEIRLGKYLLVGLITIIVFSLGFWLSHDLSQFKLSQVESLRQDLQLDVLSAETQFSLLSANICQHIDSSSLTEEIYFMGQRLDYMEGALGSDNPEVIRLKKQYSLLEIKQWQLTKEAQEKCGAELIPIIYFYSDKKACPTCGQQGYVLSFLRDKYPFLRIYSFDYNLELSALKTLKSLYSLEEDLPIIIIGDQPYYGFRDREEIEEILPQVFETLKEDQENEEEAEKASS
jgi:hypothetical protein